MAEGFEDEDFGFDDAPIKKEWLDRLFKNPTMVHYLVSVTLEWNETYDKDRAELIESILPKYDQDTLDNLPGFIFHHLPVHPDKGYIYIDNMFISDLLSRIRDEVSIFRDEDLMLSHKLAPIHLPNAERGGELSSFLGGGAYGKVYRAAYLGKQVAVKSVDSGVELSQWEKLRDLSQGAPTDIKTHLPIIYDIISDGDKDLVVTEILRPLTTDLQKFFYGSEKKFTMKDLFKDDEVVGEIHKEVLRSMPAATITQDLGKALFQFNGDSMGDFEKFLWGRIGIPVSEEQGKIVREYITSLKILIPRYLSMKFPDKHLDSFQPQGKISRSPETAGLMKTLDYLARNGLRWNDVHGGNVMMRASGDLVIIDVGLYQM
jgi:hypothetical protein